MSDASEEFQGKVILVTGASRGIGEHIALGLARGGASLILAGRDEARLEAVAAHARSQGASRVVVAVADLVAESHELGARINAAVSLAGGLYGVVNNAGANHPMHLFQDLQPGAFRSMVELNLLAQVDVTAAALPHLLRGGDGSIVNVASMAGKIGVPGWSAYCAAKHGVLGFTKALAKECALQGVRVNAVCPGFVRTDLTSDEQLADWGTSLGLSRRDVVKELIYRQTPQQRFVGPQSVARAVAFLLSPAAIDITGQALNVSCGIGDY